MPRRPRTCKQAEIAQERRHRQQTPCGQNKSRSRRHRRTPWHHREGDADQLDAAVPSSRAAASRASIASSPPSASARPTSAARCRGGRLRVRSGVAVVARQHSGDVLRMERAEADPLTARSSPRRQQHVGARGDQYEHGSRRRLFPSVFKSAFCASGMSASALSTITTRRRPRMAGMRRGRSPHVSLVDLDRP